MRTHKSPSGHGFAIIIVMIVIVVLGVLAASFAYSMKVESRLAANSNNETDLLWLGRSGVELARYVLGQTPMNQPSSLNQIWAGGPGSPFETNGVLIGIQMQDVKLGDGLINVRIRDLERRWNINLNLPEPEKKALLNRALMLVGVDPADSQGIEESILDWTDADDGEHLSGTEKDYYLGLPQPYVPKNGPVDDLAELLLVRGITPEMYWGPSAPMHRFQTMGAGAGARDVTGMPLYRVGLVDLFTPLSFGKLNINTASVAALQVLPGVDQSVAENIVRARSGPDGVEGNEDDTPFANLGALNPAMVPGIIPELAGQYGRFCTVLSSTFEVIVEARLGMSHRTYYAVVRRNNPRDLPVLQFSWE